MILKKFNYKMSKKHNVIKKNEKAKHAWVGHACFAHMKTRVRLDMET
jgi:hypothetical protein